ncbi:MAG: hypothetical protein UV82_C0002G0003 [Candidatus Magasanikbacteria bacterium GW2011_GWD2_43_18]|uniref:Uncharacterized protein n=1 Tax=Candidatus Magasanikbacteria bacterium GW2011_GWE2_42_7 TaxID=1619052 RepID=A0A0G1BH19_9BACT|nr:MAG: hypothetical protein UV18_C0003G0003 [Candidatus Magasanikbacteria bacterium GW2011_GWC2_42_27]KKS72705.1 MAG: hypothetical protein UV42_C0005G0022 [Candidatus Magasanikbacteria bacterium GW2011_GWE2_42_7]KKT05033.1 MAG: hypothetical protein UV82_C0002G0003 [Candidatus Magasanikbacteria bacterium GW2011_GWD2_43_18]KKT24750.1 MAG: hypothetical protein UW10_C0020G0003 [Candidatus Magasanikbacteria bacterium GW2011_GWA2_43_9]HBB38306.1 hypothetical protein [Candidatus Magasanikbacteria bac
MRRPRGQEDPELTKAMMEAIFPSEQTQPQSVGIGEDEPTDQIPAIESESSEEELFEDFVLEVLASRSESEEDKKKLLKDAMKFFSEIHIAETEEDLELLEDLVAQMRSFPKSIRDEFREQIAERKEILGITL